MSESTGTQVLNGLSDDARHLLEVIRGLEAEASGARPTISRQQLDERLGRWPANEATRDALRELDSIGDLENVTRFGDERDPLSFTLA